MDKKQRALDTIVKQGVLPLYFYPDATVSKEVLRTLYQSGIRCVEYTARGAAALSNFKAMITVRNAEMPDMMLGIGTIKTAQQAHDFIAAGADYIISPGTIAEVAAVTAEAGLLYIPGCMTTTEIVLAEHMGCTFIKLFPGHLLGPGYVSAILDIFPNVKFMVTGGVEVTEESIGEWFKSGVSVVGLGSKVIAKNTLEHRDYTTIASLTNKALAIVRHLKV